MEGNKSYQWNPDAKFELNANEFYQILKFFEELYAKDITPKLQAIEAFSSMVRRHIENGTIQEVNPQAEESHSK